MSLRVWFLCGMLALTAAVSPALSVAATPSPKAKPTLGASGPYGGLKYTGNVGSGQNPHAKTPHPCPAKGCKPHPKATR